MRLRIETDSPASAVRPVGTPAAARRRWDGVLRPADRDWCRAQGIALAWDAAQAGWVPDPAEGFADDAPAAEPPPSHAAGLALRPWSAADLPAFRAALDDPEVWRHLPEARPGPLTAEMAAALIEVAAAPHPAVRAVLRAGLPLGQVRLEFGPDPAQAELRYWLAQARWGRGLGRRMVAAAVDWARADFPRLTRQVARVRPANAASARALRAAGFVRAGGLAGWDLFALELRAAG